MMAYTLHHEDSKAFHVKHPDGTVFQVAKSGLSRELRNKVLALPKGYDAGGQVDPVPPEGPVDFMGNPVEGVQQPLSLEERRAAMEAKYLPQPAAPPMGTQGTPAPAPAPLPSPAPQGEGMQLPFPTIQDIGKATGQVMGMVGGGAGGTVAHAQQIERDAIAQEAAHQDMLLKHQQWSQEAAKNYSKEYDRFVGDIMGQHVDPERYWKSTSEGGAGHSKITAAIGMILGGIGAGMTGQPNLAVQIIQRGVEQDIDAQKAELGKRMNLLSAMHQKFGDMQMAENAVRMYDMAMIEGQAKLMATRVGTLEVQQRAAALSQQTRMQALQIGQQLAQQDSMRRLMSGMGGGGARLAIDEESAKKAREGIMENELIRQKVAALQAFANKHPSGTLDPAARQHATDLVADLSLSWNKAQEGLNRLNENEYELIGGWVKNPAHLTAALSGKAKVSIGDLMNAVQEKRRAIENTYLIPKVSMHPGMANLMPEYGKRMVMTPPTPPASFRPLGGE